MKEIFLFVFLFSAQSLLLGQSTLSGKVIDKESGEPIFGANIFIENSTLGTTSDLDGRYEIDGIRTSFKNIVVSHLAFKSQTIPLNEQRQIDFLLEPKIRELNAVEIEGARDRKWKRLYKKFEESFIGNSKNAKSITVNNPWVMDLMKNKDGDLTGSSLDLLEIENRATGYEIQFFVESFNQSGDQVSYSGKPLFTPLKPSSQAETDAWEEARLRTYLGSKQHFLYALINDRLQEEGFSIYDASFDQRTGRFMTFDELTRNEVFESDRLCFRDFMKVVYENKKPEAAFARAFNSSTTIDMGRRGSLELEDRNSSKNQTSYLFIKTSRGVKIDKEGFFTDPQFVLEYGYWSWERVAELLPYEYHLQYMNSAK